MMASIMEKVRRVAEMTDKGLMNVPVAIVDDILSSNVCSRIIWINCR